MVSIMEIKGTLITLIPIFSTIFIKVSFDVENLGISIGGNPPFTLPVKKNMNMTQKNLQIKKSNFCIYYGK